LTETDQPQRPRARIESLADLIFGLTLSVGAISLVSSPPTDVQGIYSDLLTFGFSFLLIITLWLRYTRIMSVFPMESRRVMNLNIALLFCVSIEPFLFNIIRNTPVGVSDPGAFFDASTTLYAVDLGAMFAILGGFTLTLASQERKLIPAELTRQYRFEGAASIVFGLLFLVSALPIFYSTKIGNGQPFREYFWLVPLLLLWVSRTVERRLLGGIAADPT
jgi:uncharacterized membrane protein